MVQKTYPTKVDWWIGLILIATVVAMIGTGAQLFFVGVVPSPWGAIAAGVCLVLAVWVGGIPFSTKYEIGPSDLIVHSMGFRWNIPFETISEVVPTHNPLSAPACSLDRLRVDYSSQSGRHRFVLISPREQQQFLTDLAQAANMQPVENRLVATQR